MFRLNTLLREEEKEDLYWENLRNTNLKKADVNESLDEEEDALGETPVHPVRGTNPVGSQKGNSAVIGMSKSIEVVGRNNNGRGDMIPSEQQRQKSVQQRDKQHQDTASKEHSLSTQRGPKRDDRQTMTSPKVKDIPVNLTVDNSHHKNTNRDSNRNNSNNNDRNMGNSSQAPRDGGGVQAQVQQEKKPRTKTYDKHHQKDRAMRKHFGVPP